jgi:hypothetical protein
VGKKGIFRGFESTDPLKTCRLTLVCSTLLLTVGTPEVVITHPYVPAKNKQVLLLLASQEKQILHKNNQYSTKTYH